MSRSTTYPGALPIPRATKTRPTTFQFRKLSRTLLESFRNWNVVGLVFVALGIGRAPGYVVERDMAGVLSFVHVVDPFRILVLVGVLEPDGDRGDGLTLVLLELELFADGMAVAIDSGELVDPDLVLRS